MLKLESRAAPSGAMALASPLIALAVTVVIGVLLFVLLGKDPLLGLRMFFVEPVKSGYAWSEIAVKAVPLVLIALGLSLCFRANVWNIGAEGQYILGAIFAGGIAMQATPDSPRAIVIVILVAGIVGGMGWAAITALLRDRFNANEILVSLMLVYVAEMVLSYLVYGPWRDPAGLQLPADRDLRQADPGAAAVCRAAREHRRDRRAGGRRRHDDLPVPAVSRHAGAGRRAGPDGGTLRRLQFAVFAVDRAADLGRPGRPGRRARSHRAARATDAVCPGGLRLRGHHRRLRRPAQSAGHRLLGGADEHVLHRR